MVVMGQIAHMNATSMILAAPAACSLVLLAAAIGRARARGWRKVFSAVALGILLRMGLMMIGAWGKSVQQPELVTEWSSVAAVFNGVFLKRVGRSPYEGGAYQRVPLLVDLFDWLFEEEFALTKQLAVYFLALDLGTAMFIFVAVDVMVTKGGEESDPKEEEMVREAGICSKTGLNKWGKMDFENSVRIRSTAEAVACMDPSNAGIFALAMYLFNPYQVASNVAMSLNCLTFFLAFGSLAASALNYTVVCAVFLGFLVHLDVLYCFMVIPLALDLAKKSEGKGTAFLRIMALFAISGAVWGLMFLFSSPASASPNDLWVLFKSLYLQHLTLKDLSPNIGLWWYFFIEMFAESREFFLYIFTLMPLVYTIPLSLTLRKRPQMLAHSLLGAFQMYTPYPEFSGISLILTVMFMHPYSVRRMSFITPFLCGIVGTSCMLPMMRFMWLTAGSGNANYYYFQTLALQFCLGALLLNFIRTGPVRDKHLRVFSKLVKSKTE